MVIGVALYLTMKKFEDLQPFQQNASV